MSSFGRTLTTLFGCFLLLAGVAAHAQVDVPTPAIPAAGATNVPLTAHFLWRPIAGAAAYEIELAYDANFERPAYANQVETSELDVADLWDDTTYYWHVRAIDTLDSLSAWSPTRSFHTIITGAPRPTSPLDGEVVPTDPFSLNFAYPTNPPSGFEVVYGFDPTFRSVTTVAVPSTSRSTPMAGLPYDTTVYWRVRVAGGAAAGPGAWSHHMRFSTSSRPRVRLGECTPLEPSNGITLEEALISSVWMGPTRAGSTVRYHLRFSQDATAMDAGLSLDDIDTTAVRIQLPDGSATWYWQVRALSTDDGMLDGPWSAISRFTIEERVETALGAPSLLLPSNGSTGLGASVGLVWDSVSGGESYEIQIGRDSTWNESDTTISSMGRSARIGGLAQDSIYYWHVRALAVRGTNRGPWSHTFSFSTASPETALPGVPTLVSPASEQVNLDPVLAFQWMPAPGAAMHVLHVSDDSTFATGVRQLGAFEGSATATLDDGRRWWWRVRGVNEAGHGPWSTVWTFTTSSKPTSVADAARTSAHGITIAPTPATTAATLSARIAPSAEARLVIAGMTGEIVHEESLRADATGSLSITLPVARLAAGIYRCRITTTTGESFDAPLLRHR